MTFLSWGLFFQKMKETHFLFYSKCCFIQAYSSCHSWCIKQSILIKRKKSKTTFTYKISGSYTSLSWIFKLRSVMKKIDRIKTEESGVIISIMCFIIMPWVSFINFILARNIKIAEIRKNMKNLCKNFINQWTLLL